MVSLSIPTSDRTVEVSIINTAARIKGAPASYFFSPEIRGFDRFNPVCYSFLITHKDPLTNRKRQLVFDLAVRRDWENNVPFLVEKIKGWGAEINCGENVADILVNHGMDLKDIEAVIWSHAHWDHMGDPATFPTTVDLIVGPGIKEAYFPGWPQRQDVPVVATAFTGRNVREIGFTDTHLTIGSMRAVDYFGDGSFYLLDAPGHAIGHLNALIRTSTSPATFMLLGADSAHHAAQLRPSACYPLPHSLKVATNLTPCPCRDSVFEHLQDNASATEPLLTIGVKPDGTSLAIDVPEAKSSIRKVQDFDADESVFVVVAHDTSLLDVVDFFPERANDWKARGWKEAGRWGFLADFHEAFELQGLNPRPE